MYKRQRARAFIGVVLFRWPVVVGYLETFAGAPWVTNAWVSLDMCVLCGSSSLTPLAFVDVQMQACRKQGTAVTRYFVPDTSFLFSVTTENYMTQISFVKLYGTSLKRYLTDQQPFLPC